MTQVHIHKPDMPGDPPAFPYAGTTDAYWHLVWHVNDIDGGAAHGEIRAMHSSAETDRWIKRLTPDAKVTWIATVGTLAPDWLKYPNAFFEYTQRFVEDMRQEEPLKRFFHIGPEGIA